MRGLGLLAVALICSGCRVYGPASFLSATTPSPAGPGKGDAYGSGGLADPTGGTIAGTRYSAGAKATSNQRVDPLLNRPAKGSGQMAGEMGVDAAPGNGKTNAPAQQGSMTMSAGNP